MNNTINALTNQIATHLIEASRAAKTFTEGRNRADLDLHTTLMGEADTKLQALHAFDPTTYNGPLRGLREAAVNLQFSDAEARFKQIAN